MNLVKEGGLRMKGHKWNQIYDEQLIKFFSLGHKSTKYQCIRTCFWTPPTNGYILFCCDGSSFGNPGATGFGVVVRDEYCQVIGTLSGGLGMATNYIAENDVVLCATELALEWGLTKIIIRSDSKTVLQEFEADKVPWFLRAIWRKARSKIASIKFEHCYREVNLSADTVAKRGANLKAALNLVCILDL
ncbi:uncharacterized protein LOC113344992 [Papaver somniferum]|uniref:uncharacterized protein LOC113344992 n=1 Tax=Papaver somniferum TaxID=3469 RepID=UPI000E7008CF|nr:uncharacterized protein LOC113344992 [Papaver somniferum]